MPTLLVDPRRLAQALGNPLANALKFTPPEGNVRLFGCIGAGGMALLTVEDNGIGMAPDMVTAAMEQIPEALTARLEPGGILIAPVGPHNGRQTLVLVRQTADGLVRKELLEVRFVPALPGIAREL